MIIKLPKREEGQGLVEYALILVLVAIVVIAILLQLGPAIGDTFCKVSNVLLAGSCASGDGDIISAVVTFTAGSGPTPGKAEILVTVNPTVTQVSFSGGGTGGSCSGGSCIIGGCCISGGRFFSGGGCSSSGYLSSLPVGENRTPLTLANGTRVDHLQQAHLSNQCAENHKFEAMHL